MVYLGPNAYLPVTSEEVFQNVPEVSQERRGGVPSVPFGLRKDLSCAGPKVRSLPTSVTRSTSTSAARAVSLGQCGLHAPAVRTVQAGGQCAGNVPAFCCKAKDGDLASSSFFPAAKFLQGKW